MPSTKDIDILSPPFKILFVAPNGLGKSIAAASFYKAGPLMIDDFDIRMRPVAAYYPGVDIRYNSWTSDNLIGFVNRIHDIIGGRHKPDYKYWVVDSMTSLSTTTIVYQLKVKGTANTKGGMPKTTWDEINGETVFFHEILEASQILFDKYGVTIIWTAHPVAKIGASDDPADIIPLASYGTKIPSLVPGFFDEIYNLTLEKTDLAGGKRISAYRSPNSKMPGKTALFNYLPNSWEVTNKNFYDVWSSYLKKKE